MVYIKLGKAQIIFCYDVYNQCLYTIPLSSFEVMYKHVMHLSMQIPTHPLPDKSGDLSVSWPSGPTPGLGFCIYSKYSLCIHLLHAPYILMAMWGCSSFRIVRVCGALAKIFAPREVSFAPPLWQISTLSREGGSGDLQW